MLRKFKPTTHSSRHITRVERKNMNNIDPEKNLLVKLPYKAAKNSHGHFTVRGRGGRSKRLYRVIDFKRLNYGIEGIVKSVEYDPYRTAYIALVVYSTGRKCYILATEGMKVGDKVISGEAVEVKEGNCMKIANIPAGTEVNNILLNSENDKGLVRAAGTSATVMGHTQGFTQIKLPSKEIRLVSSDSLATVGRLSNADNINQTYGKAGTLRRMGFRPIVRGVAQHPRSHPHGGGQGKAGRHGTGGPAVDPWGNKRFAKTRSNPRTQKFILVSRTGVKSKVTKKLEN